MSQLGLLDVGALVLPTFTRGGRWLVSCEIPPPLRVTDASRNQHKVPPSGTVQFGRASFAKTTAQFGTSILTEIKIPPRI